MQAAVMEAMEKVMVKVAEARESGGGNGGSYVGGDGGKNQW